MSRTRPPTPTPHLTLVLDGDECPAPPPVALPAPAPAPPPPLSELTDRSVAIYQWAEERLENRWRFGRASRAAVLSRVFHALLFADQTYDPGKGPFTRYARARYGTVVRAHRNKHTARGLAAERSDQDARDLLSNGRKGREAFLMSWWKKLPKICRTQRWHVASLTDEDVAGELFGRLLQTVNDDPRELARFEAPGVEATFRFLAHAKDRLRRERRIYLAPTDGKLVPIRHGSTPTPVDIIEAAEFEEALVRVHELEEELPLPDRAWATTFKMSWEPGGLLARDSSKWRQGRCNYTSAAITMKVATSTATRKRDALAALFRSEGLGDCFE